MSRARGAWLGSENPRTYIFRVYSRVYCILEFTVFPKNMEGGESNCYEYRTLAFKHVPNPFARFCFYGRITFGMDPAELHNYVAKSAACKKI